MKAGLVIHRAGEIGILGSVAHKAHFIALGNRADNALIGGDFKAGNIGRADTRLAAQGFLVIAQMEKTGRFRPDFLADKAQALIDGFGDIGARHKL